MDNISHHNKIQIGAKKIFVSTDIVLIPAQKMYESVGFIRIDISTLEPWQVSQHADIYYGMDTRSASSI